MLNHVPKIILPISFKEFLVNPLEDREKIEFLTKIQEQTYKDVLFVVTIFNEKNVQESILPHIKNPEQWIFKHTKLLHDRYKFSFTDILVNGLHEAFQYEKAICLCINTDTFCKIDFFEKIASIYEENISGAVTRHRIYANEQAVRDNRFFYAPTNGDFGFMEVIFFDANIFKSESAYNDLLRFRLDGWGSSEYILLTLFQLYAKKMVNLYNWDSIYKYEDANSGTPSRRDFRSDAMNHYMAKLLRDNYALPYDGTLSYFPLAFGFKDIPIMEKIRFLLVNFMGLKRHIQDYGITSCSKMIQEYLKESSKW